MVKTDQTSTMRPSATNYSPDAYGLPNNYAYDSQLAASQSSTGGLVLSPTLLLGAGLVLVLLLRRKR